MKTSHMDAWDNSFIMLTISEYEALSAHAPHGTHARYNAHRLNDEEACEACKDAEAEYRAELRARRHEEQGEAEWPHRQSFARTTAPQVEIEEERDQDEDEDEDERPWVDDLEDGEADDQPEDDEEYEPDDAPPAGSHAASLVQTWEMIGKLGGFRLGFKTSRPSRVSAPSANGAGTPSANGPGTDPRARLRAITTELDARKPRGPSAARLLAEAASYLTGGVTALWQYGEARGCDPQDIVAAERTVAGRGR